MNRLTVAASHDRFLRDGKPFFYLADTCWSAFTNAEPSAWEQYLDRRAAQGFNAVQITVLPQWDRTPVEFSPAPFHTDGDGKPDYGRPEDAYFEKAARMLDSARERGFLPALVVLWCDRIRDTWACKKLPANEMPLEAIEPFVRYLARVFGRFDPMWLVSGDTDMESPETVRRYLIALRAVKSATPSCLTTLHLQPQADLPDEIVQAPELDFYMYQSGHGVDQSTAYLLAQKFSTRRAKRPVVNGEPCYDGHGFGNTYGRFSSFHVRKAFWQSLLSGAKAGVAYGAHGLWNWHSRGLPFGSSDFSGLPFPWHEALQLPGATDAGYARWIFESFGLVEAEPLDSPLLSPDIRFAASPTGNLFVAYAPFPADIPLGRDLSRHESFLVNLAERSIVRPVLRHGARGTTLALPDCNADILLVARGQ